MKKVKKGNYGYVRYEKKKRFLFTFGLFVLPLVLYTVGFIQTGTRLNIFTVLAILGCLPACRSLVSMIMIFLQRPVPKHVYEEASAAAGTLTAGYELAFTMYESTVPVNALVVCGDLVVCYTPDAKAETAKLEKHIGKILAANGFPNVQVKVMKELKNYLQRAADLNGKQEHLREGLPFTPDTRYPGLSRDEVIYETLLAICL